MGSTKPADKEQFAKIAANASQIDVKVAPSVRSSSYHAINYWENNDGLDEKQMMAQLNELVKIGSVKPEHKPTYDKIVDTSLYAEAAKRSEEVRADMCSGPEAASARAAGNRSARASTRFRTVNAWWIQIACYVAEHSAADRGVAGARPQLRCAVRAVHRHDGRLWELLQSGPLLPALWVSGELYLVILAFDIVIGVTLGLLFARSRAGFGGVRALRLRSLRHADHFAGALCLGAVRL